MNFGPASTRIASKRELGSVESSALKRATDGRQSLGGVALLDASRGLKPSSRVSMGGISSNKENVKPRGLPLVKPTKIEDEIVKPELQYGPGLFVKIEEGEASLQESQHSSVRAKAIETFDETYVEALGGLLMPKKSARKIVNLGKENETLATLKAMMSQTRDKQVSFIQDCITIEQSLQTGFMELQKTKDELISSKDHLAAELQATEAKLSESAKQVANLEKENESVTREKGEIELSMKALRKTNNEQALVVQALSRDLEIKNKECEFGVTSLNAAKEEMELKNKEINELRTAHWDKEVRLQTQFNEQKQALTKELQEGAFQCKALQEAKTQLEQRLQEAALKNAENQQKLDHESSKTALAQRDLDRANREVDSLKADIASHREELKRMMESFHRTQQFHEERMTQVCDAHKELDKKMWGLQEKKEELESTLRSTTSKLELVTKKGEDEKLQLETALGEQVKALDKLSNEFTSAREDFTRTSETLMEQNQQLQSRLLAEKQASERANSELSQNLTEKDSQLIAMTQKYDEASKQLEMFKKHAGVDSLEQLDRLCRVSVEAEYLRQQLTGKDDLVLKLCKTETSLKQAKDLLYQAENSRRALHNQIQEMKGNVRVYVRVRPAEAGEEQGIEVGDQDTRSLSINSEEGKETNFQFDHVFSEKANQSDIFTEVAPLVQSSLDGYNVCLFSYGQTGSGKTFTMQGANMGDLRGIIPRSIEKIMEEAARLMEQGWVYRLEVTFLEIYNESVRDLLLEDSSEQSNLNILMNPDGGCHVPDLTRIEVTDRSQIDGIMRRAAKHRSVARTNMNLRSSRSHSVFTLHLTGTNEQKNVTLKGSLNLCDLAGSERLDKSGAIGDRLKETQAINKSLSCLAGVFTSLASKNTHIPYRDSKLTYLLQQCFSAQGKTLMLVNLSPSSLSYGESLCSLRFARQVNNVELGRPIANQQKRQSSPKRQSFTGLSNLMSPTKRNRNGAPAR